VSYLNTPCRPGLKAVFDRPTSRGSSLAVGGPAQDNFAPDASFPLKSSSFPLGELLVVEVFFYPGRLTQHVPLYDPWSSLSGGSFLVVKPPLVPHFPLAYPPPMSPPRAFLTPLHEASGPPASLRSNAIRFCVQNPFCLLPPKGTFNQTSPHKHPTYQVHQSPFACEQRPRIPRDVFPHSPPLFFAHFE